MSFAILRLKEMKIGNFFNKENTSYTKKQTGKRIPSTAQDHVDIICESKAKSVIDVVPGSGSLLIKLLKNYVEVGIGIDFATEMNEVARKRIRDAEINDNRFKILDGSFLELKQENYHEIENLYDAVSLHLVLCCHPNLEGMFKQYTIFKPKTIVLTIPRNWFIFRIIIGVWRLISKLTGSFRPYAHSQKLIDKQLLNAGYELKGRKKTIGTVMSTYELIQTVEEYL